MPLCGWCNSRYTCRISITDHLEKRGLSGSAVSTDKGEFPSDCKFELDITFVLD